MVLMDIKNTVALNLRRIRRERGLTQAQFAELAGISHSHVRQAEVGKSAYGLSNIEDICSKLGVPVHTVFMDEGAGGSKKEKMNVGEVVQKLVAIPDDIYDLAINVDRNAGEWEAIRELLKQAAGQVPKKTPHRHKTQA